MPTSPSSYTVKFGAEAWTLQYDDAESSCVVTFDADLDDLDSSNGPQVLILNPGVSCTGGVTNSGSTPAAREALVMQRVQSFLEASGYVVKRWRP
jgi:hypothetical protein